MSTEDDNLPIGSSIYYLKNQGTTNKGTYRYKSKGMGWCGLDPVGGFLTWVGYHKAYIKFLAQGNIIQIKVPSKEKYKLKIGDVLMCTNNSHYIDIHGRVYTCVSGSAVEFYFETKDGHEFGSSEFNMLQVIEDEDFVLVDGPQMVLLGSEINNIVHEKNTTNEICYWCGSETRKLAFGFGGSVSRYCEKCKK